MTSRASAITFTWDGGAGTNVWSHAMNWNPNGLPGPRDDVIIDVPGEIDVIAALTTVHSVQCEEQLSVLGGSFIMNGESSIRSLVAAEGLIGGAGRVTVTESMTWGTAILEGTAPFVIAADAVLTIANPNGRVLRRTLDNFGTIAWSGGVLDFFNGVATLNNHGAFTIDSTVNELRVSANMDGSSINNFGTMTRIGSNDVWFMPCCGQGRITFNNAGTVNLHAGEFTFMQGVHSGSIQVDGAETLLSMLVSEPIVFLPEASITGTGNLRISAFAIQNAMFCDGIVDVGGNVDIFSGDCRFNGPVRIGGTLKVEGALGVRFLGPVMTASHVIFDVPSTFNVLQFDSPSTTIGVLEFIEGTITGSADVHVTDSMTWQGLGGTAVLEGTGRTIIDEGATLTISGPGQRLRRVMENHGMAEFGGAGDQPMLLISNAGFVNHGVVSVDSNTPVIVERAASTTNAYFENHGEIVKEGTGSFSFTSANLGVRFVNTGLVEINNGRVALSGGGSNSGTMLINAPGILDINESFTHQASSSIQGSGELQLGDGGHSIQGDLSVSGEIFISGLTPPPSVFISRYYPDLDIYVHNGTLTVNAAQRWRRLEVQGTLTGNADVVVTELCKFHGTMSGNGQTIVLPGAALVVESLPILSRTLVNRGTGTWSNGGTMAFRSGTFVNAGSFTMLSNGASRFQGQTGVNAFQNFGEFLQDGTGVTTIMNAGAALPFTNDGSFSLNQGTVEIASGGVGSGAASVASGATLKLTSPYACGSLDVAGRLQFSPAGRLSLRRDYTQSATGILQLAIDTSARPQVIVGGDATLDGAVAATFIPPPPPMNSVQVLTANQSVVGQFAQQAFQPVGEVHYEPQAVVYTRFAAGDANGNGRVDIDDLLAVIGTWGVCVAPPAACSDVDGNGQVNINDLLAVIANWG